MVLIPQQNTAGAVGIVVRHALRRPYEHKASEEERRRHRAPLELDQPVGGHLEPLPVLAAIGIAEVQGFEFALVHDASPLTFMMLCCSFFWVLPRLGGRHSGLLRDLVAPGTARRGHRTRHGPGPMPLVRGGLSLRVELESLRRDCLRAAPLFLFYRCSFNR